MSSLHYLENMPFCPSPNWVPGRHCLPKDWSKTPWGGERGRRKFRKVVSPPPLRRHCRRRRWGGRESGRSATRLCTPPPRREGEGEAERRTRTRSSANRRVDAARGAVRSFVRFFFHLRRRRRCAKTCRGVRPLGGRADMRRRRARHGLMCVWRRRRRRPSSRAALCPPDGRRRPRPAGPSARSAEASLQNSRPSVRRRSRLLACRSVFAELASLTPSLQLQRHGWRPTRCCSLSSL